MPINSYTTDPITNDSARVNVSPGEVNAAVVATRELKTYTPFTGFFINDEYGADMNQDAAYGGTPDNVHDGIDNVYWTGSSIAGVKFTFNSADQNHTVAGAQSVKSDSAAVNNVMQFAKGGNLIIANYTAITFWIYVSSDWAAGDSVELYAWDVGVGMVGNPVAIENYFDWSSFGVWIKVAIPFADLGLGAGTLDAWRIRIAAKAATAPVFYLDDIQVEETGTALLYTVKPDNGAWLYLDSLRFIAVAPYDTDQADGTLPGIAWDDLLGVTITNGLVYQRWSLDEVIYSTTIKRFSDLIQFAETEWQGANDGTDTILTIESKFGRGTVLKPEELDRITYTVQDDLSTFLLLRVSVHGYVEQR